MFFAKRFHGPQYTLFSDEHAAPAARELRPFPQMQPSAIIALLQGILLIEK